MGISNIGLNKGRITPLRVICKTFCKPFLTKRDANAGVMNDKVTSNQRLNAFLSHVDLPKVKSEGCHD